VKPTALGRAVTALTDVALGEASTAARWLDRGQGVGPEEAGASEQAACECGLAAAGGAGDEADVPGAVFEWEIGIPRALVELLRLRSNNPRTCSTQGDSVMGEGRRMMAFM
jgi:hypothetical protein